MFYPFFYLLLISVLIAALDEHSLTYLYYIILKIIFTIIIKLLNFILNLIKNIKIK